MYTFGDNDEFSLRGSLSFFDGSALVDEETDTLIYPGENGILYLIKLNTSYDKETGSLSINPGKIVKWRYYGTRSSTESFWLGMEDSAAVYKGYVFMADNGGNLMCLNLNTLELVWVQDTLDDSNSTPVLEIENGHLYLYVSTSFRLGWRSNDSATIPIWKIDAETGEIIWHTDYECYTDDGVSGGVQSTIACGKTAFPITYMSQSPRLPTTLPAFLPALRNPTAPKPGKTPLPTPGLHRSASTTKTEPAKSSTATALAMSVSSMAKQENLMIPCPSATASSKPPLRYMIIWRLLVRGTARSGD